MSQTQDAPVDVQGRAFAVGSQVAVPYSINSGGSCGIQVRVVTRIEGDRVFLDGSRTAMRFNHRLAIIG